MFTLKHKLEMLWILHGKKLLVALTGVAILALAGTSLFILTRDPIEVRERRAALAAFENLGADDFAYDFDYLVQQLVENWPYLTINSQSGFDVVQAANTFRDAVLLSGRITTPQMFFDALQNEFAPLVPHLGGLRFLDHAAYYDVRDLALQNNRFWGRNSQRINNMHLDVFNRMQSHFFYDMRDGESVVTRPAAMRTDIFEVSDTVVGLVEINRMTTLLEFYQTARIMEGHYQTMIGNFLSQAQSFDHIIIDLRNNDCNMMSVLIEFNLIAPLIEEQVELALHALMLNTPLTNSVAGGYFYAQSGIQFLGLSLADSRMPIPTGGTHSFGDDAGFALRLPTTLNPARDTHPSMRTFDDRIDFCGVVWVLQDSGTAAMSEFLILAFNELAQAAHEWNSGIEFVTLGDTTSGKFVGTGGGDGGFYTYVSLPNSGIIARFDVAYYVDTNGNSLHNGIPPMRENLPGMDAMQSVLAMIADGDY